MNSNPSVWRWIAAVLAGIIITMVGTYFTVGDTVPRTEISDDHKELTLLIKENAKAIHDLTVQVARIATKVEIEEQSQ